VFLLMRRVDWIEENSQATGFLNDLETDVEPYSVTSAY
jgi:hypothetical protein